jgi:hypothetical protein
VTKAVKSNARDQVGQPKPSRVLEDKPKPEGREAKHKPKMEELIESGLKSGMRREHGKVVGVGGVFLKAQKPKDLQAWYHKTLGIPLSEYGHVGFRGAGGAGADGVFLFQGGHALFGDPGSGRC